MRMCWQPTDRPSVSAQTPSSQLEPQPGCHSTRWSPPAPGQEGRRSGKGLWGKARRPEAQRNSLQPVNPATLGLTRVSCCMANPSPRGTQAICEAAAGSDSWGTVLGTLVCWPEARGNGFGPGGQGLKPSSATSWLGVLGQFAKLSCASVSSSVKKSYLIHLVSTWHQVLSK